MKEHWRDQDTAQRMGTRTFLDAYVQEASRNFPGLSDYYTNFVVYSDACLVSKQLHESEVGFFFFRGLPWVDKELVLLSMPGGPNGDEVASYKLEKIYAYVKRIHRQREGMKHTSASQMEEDARQAHRILESAKTMPTKEDIMEAAKGVRKEQATTQLPPNVDPEID